ncbi:las1-like protein [Heterostelium album PN500]|uniref:Las1-like protein n=1 Tax=Heterostelium pallidum (strain ATCC 26659 / Pp 5 / PN500) TaxID=670386 RepID=D3BFJ5_HETP5|nr:las1-like protein [Heterostelium album PN500]EFA79909.1 las1-like protein [Heterostelium album PN500]|eukprot:XP_020432030.1 las1-like protein [Heterostelium album PN500]
MDNTGSLSNKVVCWIDWEEWKDVYRWIYSEDKNEQLRAINRVAAWKSRGRLPLAVEATSSFIEILYHSDSRTENERVLCLSMAINRLVNGVLESTQKGGAATMFSRAAQMNLPSHFVEIRHEAAHGTLPSIRLLKNAASTGLSWLDDFYWKTQAEQLDDYRSHLKRLLSRFAKEFRAQKFTNLTTQIHWMSPRVRTLTQDISAEITAGLLESVLVPMLIDDCFIIPAGTQLQKGDYQLPESIQNQWSPLLKSLHTKYVHFLTILLYLMVDRIASPKKSQPNQSRLMTAWVIYLLRNKDIFDFKKQLEASMELPHRYLFERCLRSRATDAPVLVEAIGPMLSTRDQKAMVKKKGNKLIDPLSQYEAKSSAAGRWRLIDMWTPCPIGVAPTDSSITQDNQKGLLDLPESLNNKDNITLVQCIQEKNIDKTLQQTHWINEFKELYPDLLNKNNIIQQQQQQQQSININNNSNNNNINTQIESNLSNNNNSIKTKRECNQVEDSEEKSSTQSVNKVKKQRMESVIDSSSTQEPVDKETPTNSTTKSKSNTTKKKKSVGSKVDLLQFWK